MPIFISQDVDEVVNEPLIGWHDLLHQNMAGVSDLDGMQQRRNALNGLTYNFWEVNTGLNQFAVDLGSPQSVDYVGIAAHTLGSDGRRVQVQRSTNGTSWTRAHSEEWFAPSTDAPLMIYFPEQSYRHWRLLVEAGPRAYVAVLYLGRVLRMKRRIYGGHTPASLSRQTDILPQRSVNGAFLGRSVIRRGIATTYAFNNLPADWYRENVDPFVQSALERPFFIAWRPDDHPEECIYAWTTGDIAPTNTGTRDFMSVSFSVEGIAE